LDDFLEVVQAALGESLDQCTADEFLRIQVQLRSKADRLVADLDTGMLSREAFYDLHTELLREAMTASEKLLGHGRFMTVFGEAGKHPEGLIDRDAFLSQGLDDISASRRACQDPRSTSRNGCANGALVTGVIHSRKVEP
jgi:hypothetical protein